MYDREAAPTEAQVAPYAHLWPMLKSALQEMREFAKKKQDGMVSPTKTKILNRLLVDLRVILGSDDSIKYLDLLSDEDIPQNSDVVLVLGQYHAALHNFERKHKKGVTWMTKEWIDEQEKERIAQHERLKAEQEEFEEEGENDEDE